MFKVPNYDFHRVTSDYLEYFKTGIDCDIKIDALPGDKYNTTYPKHFNRFIITGDIYRQSYQQALLAIRRTKHHISLSHRHNRLRTHHTICNNSIKNLYKRTHDALLRYRVTDLDNRYLSELHNPKPKIHNSIHPTEIDDDTIKILSLGGGFIPTLKNNYITRSEKIDIQQDIHKAIRGLIIKDINKTTIFPIFSDGKYNTQTLLHHPDLSHEVRNFAEDKLLYLNLHIMHETLFGRTQTTGNITNASLKSIINLSNNPNIIITGADKNLGLCINSTKWYMMEYKRQLSDTDTYQEIPYHQLTEINTKSITELHALYSKHKSINSLYIKGKDLEPLLHRKLEDIIMPSLNITPKPHKLNTPPCISNEHLLKGRPICNGFACINTEPSRILGKLLRKFLNILRKDLGTVCPIVDSSLQVIQHLYKLNFDGFDSDNIYFISFDFASLYTSLKVDTILQMFHRLKSILQLDEETITLMIDLFTFVKQHAYFHVAFSKLYLQKEGLAMGSYDSAESANLSLLMSEIDLHKDTCYANNILAFYRYIDDGALILNLPFPEISIFIAHMKNHYPPELEINFKINKFCTTFLDITFGLHYTTFASGKLHFSVYQKPFNTYSYTNFSSGHPAHIFKGIIITECHRYITRSCDESEYKAIVKLFTLRLRRCGYHKKFIKKHLKPYRLLHTQKPANSNRIFAGTTYHKTKQLHLIVKNILTKNPPFDYRFTITTKNTNKLKRILCTKQKLHRKLQKYICTMTNF